MPLDGGLESPLSVELRKLVAYAEESEATDPIAGYAIVAIHRSGTMQVRYDVGSLREIELIGALETLKQQLLSLFDV